MNKILKYCKRGHKRDSLFLKRRSCFIANIFCYTSEKWSERKMPTDLTLEGAFSGTSSSFKPQVGEPCSTAVTGLTSKGKHKQPVYMCVYINTHCEASWENSSQLTSSLCRIQSPTFVWNNGASDIITSDKRKANLLYSIASGYEMAEICLCLLACLSDFVY